MMKHMFVFSQDEQFRELCRQAFTTQGGDVCLEFGRDLRFNQNQMNETDDEIIIHTGLPGESWFYLYQKAREKWPTVRIVFATETYDYMYDFRYWMADDCIVISETPDTAQTPVMRYVGRQSAVS